MSLRRHRAALWATVGALSMILAACGGGGGSGGSGGGNTPPPALVISSNSILPGGLQDHPYSTTLTAVNGSGSLHWSIAPLSSTALFVDGLSIKDDTGVLSGTLKFGGTGGFQATVRDSASPPHTATKSFTITAYSPLQPLAPQTFQVGQFSESLNLQVGPMGGVQPITAELVSGRFPFGMKIQNIDPYGSGYVIFTGSPTEAGTFPITLRIQDSYFPPEVVTTQVTVEVLPPPLQISDSLSATISLNRPFSSRVVVRGGVPPYQFAKTSGNLPPGFNPIDPSNGQVNGTPTTAGSYIFEVTVTDSSSPAQSAAQTFFLFARQPLGRNDTVAKATLIGEGQFDGSFSPYIDPPGNAPLPADNDYYKLTSVSGAEVHIEVHGRSQATDTVLEIVDGNNHRLANCNQPSGTTLTFTSACINDDAGEFLDSSLDFKVPGSPNTPTTFYLHLLDFRGDARPDMTYSLYVSGTVTPLTIEPRALLPANRGLSYSDQLGAQYNNNAVSWSLASSNLPPGLMINSSGVISGTATTDGTYNFTVQVSDSSSPPQTATAQKSIRVGPPLAITSPATLPDGCVNKSYSFTPQTSGGFAPLFWFPAGGTWPLAGLDQATGTMSGIPPNVGTFSTTIWVLDASQRQVSQTMTLSVKQCP